MNLPSESAARDSRPGRSGLPGRLGGLPRGVLLATRAFLFLSGACLLARRGWLEAKGLVAEILIDQACDAYLLDGKSHPPWSWADTYPIGRLEVERLGVCLPVLSGASGTSMAFGVGHIDGTALPNHRGNCVLAGHRDRWMSFLAALERGDRIRMTTRNETREYCVDHLDVVPKTELGALDPGDEDRLTLVTCYPIGGLLRSADRYVVACRRSRLAPGSRQVRPCLLDPHGMMDP